MASPTQWTGVWASFRRWWRTRKPGVLQSMGSQRVRHNCVIEQLLPSFSTFKDQVITLSFTGYFRIIPLFYFYFLNKFIYFNWRLITLQYFSGFCHPLAWISHGCTCVPHPERPTLLPPQHVSNLYFICKINFPFPDNWKYLYAPWIRTWISWRVTILQTAKETNM